MKWILYAILVAMFVAGTSFLLEQAEPVTVALAMEQFKNPEAANKMKVDHRLRNTAMIAGWAGLIIIGVFMALGDVKAHADKAKGNMRSFWGDNRMILFTAMVGASTVCALSWGC